MWPANICTVLKTITLSGEADLQQPQPELLQAGPRVGQVLCDDHLLRQTQQQTIHPREANQIQLQGNFHEDFYCLYSIF